MILSRIWYVILAFVVGMAIYVTYVAVGQYNRRNQVAMTEGLAADSQVVRWSLQIDARRRLDALLVGSVDKGIQDSLVGANGKDKVPPKSKDEAHKALEGVLSKLPAEYKPDAIFAVDRDGRVVAQIGYDAANAFDDFELGGYPAVFDALHGYLRDDTWVLGGRVYRVSARPVEYDVTQPPAGAIVGLRAVDARFAQDLSKLTRTNVVFYANGVRVASASGSGDDFDDKALETIAGELPKVEADKGYQDTGHSGFLTIGDTTGATYTRFEGDAWELHAGYAVVRQRVAINGPNGFLTGADDKDKQSVSWPVIIAVVLLGSLFGIGFTLLEHTMPMREMKTQATRLMKGEIDLLQLARFRYGYRPIAQDINAGIERVAEKGGAPRKQADLESILGPVPAQPSMSAFSFPQPGDASAPASAPNPARITGPGLAGPGPVGPVGPGFGGPMPPGASPRPGLVGNPPNGGPGFPAREAPSNPGLARPGAPPSNPGLARPGGPPPPVPHRDASKPNLPPGPPPRLQQPATPAAMPNLAGDEGEEEATRVGAVSKEVMDAASGQHGAVGDDSADWLTVYEDFVRTKKQCGEPTDGLTFEKFQHTLRKNRDALVQRHGCKRVRFSVYVKEGRASLKATPVKE